MKFIDRHSGIHAFIVIFGLHSIWISHTARCSHTLQRGKTAWIYSTALKYI